MSHKEKMKCASNKAKDVNVNLNPHMHGNMNMEHNMNPTNMDVMGEKRIENLYPKTYFILIPTIRQRCDEMEHKKGQDHIPDREEFEEMIEKICEEVEEAIERELDDDDDDCDNNNNNMMRQRGRRRRRRRRLIRDLVGFALIGELLGRRRRRPYPPPYGYPIGYPGPGYYPPYPGY